LESYLEKDVFKVDGSWNITKKVNSPKLVEGMVPIYWDENGIEPNINNIDLNNKNSKAVYGVTGMYADGVSNPPTEGIFIGNAYNTKLGQLGSSTGNITGVYDLNGCVLERVSAYLGNTAGKNNRDTYGLSLSLASMKYKREYLSNEKSGSSTDQKRTANYKANSMSNSFGDALRETSATGTGVNSWNGDASGFLHGENIFLGRGNRIWK